MKLFYISFILLWPGLHSYGQKKPLDHTVYNSWQSIGERMISRDGQWVAYTIDPQEGDNELVIQSANATYKKVIPRGYNALITTDSRFCIFNIRPLFADTRAAKIKKLKVDAFPKDSFGIVELGKEDIIKTARVKNFRTPANAFGWVAWKLEKPFDKNNRSDTGLGPRIDSLTKIIDSLTLLNSERRKEKKAPGKDEAKDEGDEDAAATAANEPGTLLTLRNLLSGEEKTFTNVQEYLFAKNGSKLLVEQVRNPKDTLTQALIILYDLNTSLADTVSRGGNDFKNFTMTDDGAKLAFVAERTAKPKDLQKFYSLLYYTTGMDSAVTLVDKNAVGMTLGMTVSENATLAFSRGGGRLFFGTAPIAPPKDTSLVDIDLVKLDLWHYNDDYLQPAQLKTLRDDLKENFLAVYDFSAAVIRQLGSKELPEVLPSNEGDGALFVGVTDFGKRIESQWTGNTKKDIYAVNVEDSSKKLVRENLSGLVYPSSTGKYILWYDRTAKAYFIWDGVSARNISSQAKVAFYDEENDVPDEPAPYGVMGWQQGDSAVFVYDRYDVWKLPVNAGAAPLNITRGMGKTSKTSFRLFVKDKDRQYFRGGEQLFFRKSSEVTKESALAIVSLEGNRVLDITLRDVNFFIPPSITEREISARSTILYTRESFTRSPDLYIAGSMSKDSLHDQVQATFVDEQKLSAINPQQQKYNWGTAELFHWTAYNGKVATGILYKPENFDPRKRYPMICYFYERSSDNLFKYYPPSPIRSAINIPFYTSRGYVIFVPDIEYVTGHPGKSAYDYVVSGARALVKKGIADSANLALQGHSWGGYQVAQLVTMTKLFKAAWAGAPVANMTSAYGGIRWETGINRQFQYEKTQSRIGATLWDKPQLYIENSPLFHLKNVVTPVVIMHNDNDGAVPWYQGIELFTALRRLNKKVWLLNYNGEGHGLSERKNKLDYQIRMQQFFDWMLKGAKPAPWIIDGIPAVKKGRDWGLGD